MKIQDQIIEKKKMSRFCNRSPFSEKVLLLHSYIQSCNFTLSSQHVLIPFLHIGAVSLWFTETRLLRKRAVIDLY